MRRSLGFESLEGRRLLAYTGPLNPDVTVEEFDIGLTGEEFRDLLAEQSVVAELGPEFGDKVTSQFWLALEDARNEIIDRKLNGDTGRPPLSEFRSRADYNVRLTDDGDINVDFYLTSLGDSAVAKLRKMGVRVNGTLEFSSIVNGWVDPEILDDLAALDSVTRMAFPIRGVANSGLVNTAGDVRNQFAYMDLDGGGVRVGVNSDGVAHRNYLYSSGDLPPSGIYINPSLPGSGGGDEGSALLEIVHDLAPGATLYFSSGIAHPTDMIHSINWMVSQCDWGQTLFFVL